MASTVWEVKHPFFYSNEQIDSETFSLDPLGTYKLQLLPQQKENCTRISGELKRQSGYEQNKMPYDLDVSFDYNNQSLTKAYRNYFGGDIILFEEFDLVLKELRDLQNRVARCKLTLKSGENASEFRNEWEVEEDDLERMSSDFNRFFSAKEMCDLAVKTADGKTVKLHKHILQAQFPAVARHFVVEHSSSTNCPTRTLDINKNEVDAFLQFVNSGRINLGAVSSSLKDWCNNFQPSPLRGILYPRPKETVIYTSVESRYTCLTYSVSNLFLQGMLQKHILHNELFDSANLNVVFSIENTEHEMCGSFDMVYAGERKLHVICKVTVSGNGNFQKSWGHTFLANSVFTVDLGQTEIVRRNNKTLPDTLKLKSEFVISYLNPVSGVASMTSSEIQLSKTAVAKDLQTFQKHFENFFKISRMNPNECDVKIKVGNKIMPAHRAILAARAPNLLNDRVAKLWINGSKTYIGIEDQDPEIVEVCLQYIYTATVDKVSDYDKATKLYRAVIEFKIFQLKNKCAKFLARNLTIHNFLKTLKLADQYGDKFLEESVKKFVLENANNVKPEDVKYLIDERIDLADRILTTALIQAKQSTVDYL